MNLPPARRVLALAAAAAVGMGAGVGAYALGSSHTAAATTTTVVAPAQSVSSTSTGNSLTQLYKNDAPGVVYLTVSVKASSGGSSTNPFGLPGSPQTPKETAVGTGFVIDKQGNIMTAEHVVAGATAIKVTFENGTSTTATLVGKDGSTDTAVVHVDVPASELHPLALGNSAAVLPGQQVVAIGTPFNTSLAETMTAGIVSAVNRSITAPNNFAISGAIQTDAAINHGNSGGPLIDVATNTVIGINDQILNAGDTNDNAGVGFAVPINSAWSTARTLIAGGTVKHAYMGVRIATAANGNGAAVAQVVANSPAAKAGLKVGDVIVAFGNKKIANADELSAAVFASRPGQTVTVTVERHGATQHVPLTLGVQPAIAH